MSAISVHLHSLSMRYHLRHAEEAGGFDAHAMIEFAKAAGFSGVTFAADGPNYRHLGGMSGGHLRSIGSHVASNGVTCQVDTSDTRFENMKRMLAVAGMLQADTLRVATTHQGSEDEVVERTIADLVEVAPYAADAGVTVVVENDDAARAEAVARVVAAVNDVGVKALFDFGTPQAFGSDPADALAAVAPWTVAANVKDQVLVEAEGQVWIQGMPIGHGGLPIEDLTATLVARDVARLNLQSTWGQISAAGFGPADLTSTGMATAPADTITIADEFAPADVIRLEREAVDEAWDNFSAVLAEAGHTVV